jgi:hypothetical protein
MELNRYCDLTENQVGFLRDPARAHPAARAAFVKDGLLFPDGVTLTPDGRKALEIAEAYLSGQRKPEPPIVIIQDGVEIRFAPDRQRGLNAVHFKVLLALARWPGLAWRYLCATYGPGVVQKLWREDYILGRPVRGAPQYLTWKGLSALEEALKRAGVKYFKQLELEGGGGVGTAGSAGAGPVRGGGVCPGGGAGGHHRGRGG